MYRNGTTYKDEYPAEIVQEATGLTSAQYTELKQKMLKSVYKNGGFYVGKYEMGIDYEDAKGHRTATGDATQTPVIKQNAYPYNYVTNAQAQTLASNMESGEYTTSLMFGVQWDLVLKYLETKNAATVAELKGGDGVGSTNWGNYNNNLWNITNEKAKYSTNHGVTYTVAPYQKTANASILLTTGADNAFSKMGIYDIAGNVWAWTLEYTSDSSTPCARRGGNYYDNGNVNPPSYRTDNSTTDAYNDVGLRSSLF